MYCPKCGTKIEGRQRFCPTCGEMLGKAAAPERQVSSVGSFFKNNVFRLLIAAVMISVCLIMMIAFFNEFGMAFSALSGLERGKAAISTCIYVLAVFIPMVLALETIRKSFFISAKIIPKEFNLRGYAVSKGALLPMIIELLAGLVLVIAPLILYNYSQRDTIATMAVILERYRNPAIICCLLTIAAIVLVVVSRQKVGQKNPF